VCKNSNWFSIAYDSFSPRTAAPDFLLNLETLVRPVSQAPIGSETKPLRSRAQRLKDEAREKAAKNAVREAESRVSRDAYTNAFVYDRDAKPSRALANNPSLCNAIERHIFLPLPPNRHCTMHRELVAYFASATESIGLVLGALQQPEHAIEFVGPLHVLSEVQEEYMDFLFAVRHRLRDSSAGNGQGKVTWATDIWAVVSPDGRIEETSWRLADPIGNG
jgi:hypothetical protein